MALLHAVTWRAEMTGASLTRSSIFAFRNFHTCVLDQPLRFSRRQGGLSGGLLRTLQHHPRDFQHTGLPSPPIGTTSVLSRWQARILLGRRLPNNRPQSTLVLPADYNPTQQTLTIDKHGSQPSTSRFSAAAEDTPRLTSPSVATHLYIISGLVFAIVVVGGLTRLTESGLSITEWNLVTGTLPPLNAADWQDEYEKYIISPEGTLMNKGMTMNEFKRIYAWEWGHRFLGRVIGLAFLAPIPYFALKRKLSGRTAAMLAGIATLIGGQGALGWYMVKSGITHEAIQARDGVPRVSQYRLAAHLGMAFLVYSLALRHAVGIKRDWAIAKLGQGLSGVTSITNTLRLLNTPQAHIVRRYATAMTALVFLTAISGAFVAGLDAGLMYNTFPHMGDDWIPPISELYSHKYAKKADQSDLFLRNSLENPTTVQFDHRVLATSTFFAIAGLFLLARRPHVRNNIPATSYKWIRAMAGMAVLQVTLGISTLVYMVPVELAATHQAGSLALLSLAIAAGASLRRPSAATMRLLCKRSHAITPHNSHAPVAVTARA